MDGLAELGKIAGLAGITIGGIVLIFKSIIERVSGLPQDQASRILRIVAVLSFAVAIAGLIAWGWVNVQPKTDVVNAQALGECLQRQDGGALISAGGSVKIGGDLKARICGNIPMIKANCGDVVAGGKVDLDAFCKENAGN